MRNFFALSAVVLPVTRGTYTLDYDFNPHEEETLVKLQKSGVPQRPHLELYGHVRAGQSPEVIALLRGDIASLPDDLPPYTGEVLPLKNRGFQCSHGDFIWDVQIEGLDLYAPLEDNPEVLDIAKKMCAVVRALRDGTFQAASRTTGAIAHH